MVWDELSRQAEESNRRDRDRWIGVYIGILAVVLAICSMGGGNAAKIATLRNIEAADTWSFFQAKNMRRHVLRVAVDEFEIKLASDPGLPDDVRAKISAKIADYKKQDEILTKDPDKDDAKREGLDQLFDKGKRLEVERDLALSRDPYFDYGEALLQIAIVLASIALITHAGPLLVASAFLGVAGVLLTINGFLLLVKLPYIG